MKLGAYFDLQVKVANLLFPILDAQLPLPSFHPCSLNSFWDTKKDCVFCWQIQLQISTNKVIYLERQKLLFPILEAQTPPSLLFKFILENSKIKI